MEHRRFEGHRGLALAADIAGPAQGRPVVLLHGGGQTRGSWKNGLKALVERGYRVFSIDARGHGESGWDPDQDYSLYAQVADLTALLAQLPDSPALV